MNTEKVAVDEGVETARASRRALLAKAAVAGGIIYAAPLVSKVPAYAAPGLRSWKTQSGSLCVWFSPNQAAEGNWYSITPSGGPVAVPGTLSVTVSVGGTNRTVQFSGIPNNDPGTEGRATAEPFEWYGQKYGGAKITMVSANCEVLVEAVVCSSNSDCTNNQTAPAPWSTGSSDNPIGLGVAPPTPSPAAPGGIGYNNFTGTVYYHTGRRGRGDSQRCKFGMQYRIRCW